MMIISVSMCTYEQDNPGHEGDGSSNSGQSLAETHVHSGTAVVADREGKGKGKGRHGRERDTAVWTEGRVESRAAGSRNLYLSVVWAKYAIIFFFRPFFLLGLSGGRHGSRHCASKRSVPWFHSQKESITACRQQSELGPAFR